MWGASFWPAPGQEGKGGLLEKFQRRWEPVSRPQVRHTKDLDHLSDRAKSEAL